METKHLILNTIEINSLLKAHRQLEAALAQAKSELERAGAIQCFEYSFELAWKTLRKVLVVLGRDDCNSPRAVFRAAADTKLINNPEHWFLFIECRNRTVHTYDQTTAQEIFDMLPDFYQHLTQLIKTLQSLS